MAIAQPRWRAYLSSKLELADFVTLPGKTVFEALSRYDGPLEYSSFRDWLHNHGLLRRCDGARLSEVFSPSVASPEYLDWHIAQLRDARFRREGAERLTAFARRLQRPDEKCEELISALGVEMSDLASLIRGPGRRDRGVDAAVDEFLKGYLTHLEGNAEPGVPTRWRSWNRDLGNIKPGEMLVVGGPTGSGKSALAANLTLDALLADHGVAYFSYEMPRRQIVARLISDWAGVEMSKVFRPGAFPPSALEKQAVEERAERLKHVPLHLFDDPTLTPAAIRAECQAIRMAGKLTLAIVDYLQLMPASRMDKGANREQIVAGISRDLRALSIELDIAVIALSQLNEQGAFRESRAIGQDATMAIAIYEEGLSVEKNRNGPSGAVLPVKLDGQFMRFVE